MEILSIKMHTHATVDCARANEAPHLQDRALLRTGLVGSAVAALCCFIPVLVVLLGAVGLSAIVGWLDFVLLPALAIFVALTAYALLRRRRAAWRS